MKDARSCITHILKMTLDSGTHKNSERGWSALAAIFQSQQMRFTYCGFPLRTPLTPSQTNAAKTSIKPLPWRAVGWGFCDAPGTCRAKVSVPGPAPRRTESSQLRQPLPGCEWGSRPRRRLLLERKQSEPGFNPQLDWRNCHSTANARRAIKRTAVIQWFPIATSTPGKRCIWIISADLPWRPAAGKGRHRATRTASGHAREHGGAGRAGPPSFPASSGRLPLPGGSAKPPLLAPLLLAGARSKGSVRALATAQGEHRAVMAQRGWASVTRFQPVTFCPSSKPQTK